MSDSQLALANMLRALSDAKAFGLQYQMETGINILQHLDLDPAPGNTPSVPAGYVFPDPVYDADGVSQPMGDYGLVMLRDVELIRENVAQHAGEASAAKVPKVFACRPGQAKLQPRSDAWWIQDTEIAHADFGGLGTNQFEALLVNVYEISNGAPGALPSERLIRKYQEYVPGAMALPSRCDTAAKCVAQVAAYTRTRLDNEGVKNTGEIDFGPFPH